MFLAPFMSRSITRLQLEHLYTSEEPTSVSNPHLVHVLEVYSSLQIIRLVHFSNLHLSSSLVLKR